VCGVTWAADAAEVLLVGFALPSIRAEFGLDAVTGSLLATAGFVGMLLGALVLGTRSRPDRTAAPQADDRDVPRAQRRGDVPVRARARYGTAPHGGIAMSAFSLGAWGARYAYKPELYPTAVRGTGFGAASGMSRVAGALAPVIGGALLASSLVLPLGVYAAGFLLGAAVVGLLGVETRGRPLEDALVPEVAAGR